MNDEQHDLTPEDILSFGRGFRALKQEITKAVKGFDHVIEKVLVAFFAGGHVLLEGEPGLGKTLLVKSLARALGLEFKRIQFTPDLMPADIVGTDVLVEDQATGARELQFRPGPIFTHILLADEINRATPKTQSALLEAMGEGQVTVFGRRYTLEQPFFVIATQNPIEMEGTYPLPEAQLDRFFFKLITPFPDHAILEEILRLTTTNVRYEELPQPVIAADDLRDNMAEQERLRDELRVIRQQGVNTESASKEERLRELESEALLTRRRRILRMRETVRGVLPTPQAFDFVINLIGKLRNMMNTERLIDYSPGPRAAQALILAGKVMALIKEENQGYAFPTDIEPNTLPALRHRLILNFEAEAQQQDSETILKKALA